MGTTGGVLMEAQQFENQPLVRIKFASVGPGDFLVSDAGEEYSVLLEQQPTGWTLMEEGQITTKAEGSRHTWLLDRDGVRIAVVAHETGVEIILGVVGTIAAAVAVDLAKDAVVEFSKWLWRRWKWLRATEEQNQRKVDPSLRLECNIVRLSGGVTGSTVRLEVRAPITDEALAQLIDKFLADYALPSLPNSEHIETNV